MENYQLHSEQINELAGALSKFQGQIESAKKAASNPHFRTKYADLTAVWDAIRDVLPLHGLSVVQSVVPTSDGKSLLVTTLLHLSGQWFRSYLPLMIDKPTSQALGSALSYARRYALSSICGVSTDDDDGHAATRHIESMREAEDQKKSPPPPPVASIEQIKSLVTTLECCSDEYKKNFWEHLKKINRTLQNLPIPVYEKLLARTCTERDSFMQEEKKRIEEAVEN